MQIIRPIWRPAFFLFERAGESGDFNPFCHWLAQPVGGLLLFFFSVTVHDLATLLTGHADHTPDVEARVLHAGVSFFRELEIQVISTRSLARPTHWHVGGLLLFFL